MRVLHVCQDFPGPIRPYQGVFVQRSLEAMRAAMGAEFEPEVLSPTAYVLPFRWFPHHELARVPRIETVSGTGTGAVGGYRVHHPRYLYPAPKRLFYHLAGRTMARAMLNYARGAIAKPDLVHTHYPYPEGYAMLALAGAWGLPLVVHERGSILKRIFTAYPKVAPLILAALHGAAAVIAVSEELRQRCIAEGVDARKVHCISDGVDIERFRPRDKRACREQLGLGPDGLVLLFVGNIVPVKGLDELIRAAPAIMAAVPDLTLILLGGADRRFLRALRQTADWTRCADRLVVLGPRLPEEVPLWMNAADLVILPSLSEGRPSVVFETLASGTPMIATRVGGVPELIEHSRTGILIEPGDPRAITASVLELLAAPERMAELGRRGRASILERGLVWEQHAKALADVYAGILGSQ